MSVKVNLLPREVELRARERRRALLSAAGVGAWVLVLVLVYVGHVASTGNAREERDGEQAELDRLEARAQELAPYRALARRLDTGNTLLASAMGAQVAWSGVLNDLALVFPSNSSLLTLNASVAPPAPGQPARPLPGVGSLVFTGYSIERYAPGVESVLLGLDDAASFESLYVESAQRALIQQTLVTNFTGSGRLTDAIFTRRFANGLPEGES